MVVVAFMQPDFEMVLVQVFSLVVQPLGAIPPLPLSGVHVQPDNVNSTEGVTVVLKVTDCALATDLGVAFTVNWGRKIVTTGLPRCQIDVTAFQRNPIDIDVSLFTH